MTSSDVTDYAERLPDAAQLAIGEVADFMSAPLARALTDSMARRADEVLAIVRPHRGSHQVE
jgi:hypothetical protein